MIVRQTLQLKKVRKRCSKAPVQQLNAITKNGKIKAILRHCHLPPPPHVWNRKRPAGLHPYIQSNSLSVEL